MLRGVLVEKEHVVAHDLPVPQYEKHVVFGRVLSPAEVEEGPQSDLRTLLAGHAPGRDGRFELDVTAFKFSPQGVPDNFLPIPSPEFVFQKVCHEWGVRKADRAVAVGVAVVEAEAVAVPLAVAARVGLPVVGLEFARPELFRPNRLIAELIDRVDIEDVSRRVLDVRVEARDDVDLRVKAGLLEGFQLRDDEI